MAAGHAGDPMDVGQAVIVAGIGCRAGATAREIEAVLEAAASRAKLDVSEIGIIATSHAKIGEQGIADVASLRGARLVIVAQSDLEAASAHVVTRSERVKELIGIPSLAEAAALAAAGPNARLITPRVVIGRATCALAVSGDVP
jgi:cobalt-precorrin 5A hydrolase